MHARATIGFGFTSHWLKKWRENFEPITEWSNAKPKQFSNYFDTQLKTSLVKNKIVEVKNKIVERVSIECRKTKPKLFTLAIKRDGDNPVNQSKLEVITSSRHKVRENVHAQATIGFGFTLIGWKNGAKTLNQSLSEVIINQSNSLITLDAQLETALIRPKELKKGKSDLIWEYCGSYHNNA